MQENKRRGWIFIALAVVAAILVGFLTFQRQNTLETMIGELDTVIVASQAIPARTTISTTMLTEMQIPSSVVHNSYVFNRADVIDFVAITDIEEGQIIQRNMIDPQLWATARLSRCVYRN